jgi:hypothetical protein
MAPAPIWINEVSNAIEAMWAKLHKYYTATDKPLHMSMLSFTSAKKLSLFKKDTWESALRKDIEMNLEQDLT